MESYLTKADVVASADRRVQERFGLRFTEAALNDLVKDNLAPEAKRLGNQGRKPVFGYRWRDLHRVLFLATLQAHGVRRRDAMRLRLFLAGCSLPIDEVRMALSNEFRHAVASANALTRSAYLDNRRPITPARMGSISREIGTADPVLREARLEVPVATAAELLRSARYVEQKASGFEFTPLLCAFSIIVNFEFKFIHWDAQATILYISGNESSPAASSS